MCVTYRNYEELLEENTVAGSELIEEKGDGEWRTNDIYFYEDIESFAEYELVEGWYFDMNIDRNFNGAPSPLSFIDLKALGTALVNTWDDSCYFLTKNGEVLSTAYGW